MEKYLDEIIIKEREELKKEKYSSIKAGMYIKGKIIHFERKKLLDRFLIYLPDMVRKMPSDLARIKYPSEFRPNLIYSTLNLNVNMGFSLLQKLQVSNIEMLVDRMMKSIADANPEFRFFECKKMKKQDGMYFAFRSRAMDSPIYNMMLLTPLGEDVLLGNFNCLYSECQEWKRLVLPVWESVKELENKEGTKG